MQLVVAAIAVSRSDIRWGGGVNYDPILLALVAAVQMLDGATNDQVDQHFAVQVQEVIGSYLSELSREDMDELRQMAARIAAERSSVDPAIAGHLRRLAATRQ